MPKPKAPAPSPNPADQPKPAAKAPSTSSRFSWQLRLPQSKRERWLTLAGATVAIALIVLAVPYSRYGLIGQFVKKPATIDVVDSRTHKPVSDVAVTVGNATYTSDAKGEIKLAQLPVGSWAVTVKKRYYGPVITSIMQPLFGSPKTFQVSLVAIGNQVTVKVVNKITGQPLTKAVIGALGTTATTDASGQAVIVLPVQSASVPGNVTASGYNNQSATIKNATTDAAANTFGLTPAGKIFYLDKRTGVINVMKSNLDGTDPQVVVTGTGKESDTSTVLLASRDWKYLALEASRNDSTQSNLYIINTATGQLSVMDQGNATFNPVGWDDDYFIYGVDRPGSADQPGLSSIKSFNGATGHLATLFTNGSPVGGSPAATSDDLENILISGKSVIFTRQAQFDYPTPPIVSIVSVQADGSGLTPRKDLTLANTGINARPYSPDEIAFEVAPYYGGPDSYYELDGDTVTQKPNVNPIFSQNFYPTYLLSPSGNQTLWYDQRDGKNTLFTGDASGDNPKTIASLSDYTPYGWYTDNYILLSKEGSELYIAPADLSSPPIKITDYHKPAVTFNGYGGGYGGQ